MNIEFAVTPAHLLPRGVHATVTEGKQDVIIQVSSGATIRQACEALTEIIGPYAEQSWVHVGALDWEDAEPGTTR